MLTPRAKEESGQTASILRMPGHGLGKFCNISRLGMALATYYKTQIHQDGCCLSTFQGGWVFRGGDVSLLAVMDTPWLLLIHSCNLLCVYDVNLLVTPQL